MLMVNVGVPMMMLLFGGVVTMTLGRLMIHVRMTSEHRRRLVSLFDPPTDMAFGKLRLSDRDLRLMPVDVILSLKASPVRGLPS